MAVACGPSTSVTAQQGPQLFWKSIMATTKATESYISAGRRKALCILQALCLWLVGWSGFFFFPTDSLHFYCYLLELDTSQDTQAGIAKHNQS